MNFELILRVGQQSVELLVGAIFAVPHDGVHLLATRAPMSRRLNLGGLVAPKRLQLSFEMTTTFQHGPDLFERFALLDRLPRMVVHLLSIQIGHIFDPLLDASEFITDFVVVFDCWDHIVPPFWTRDRQRVDSLPDAKSEEIGCISGCYNRKKQCRDP